MAIPKTLGIETEYGIFLRDDTSQGTKITSVSGAIQLTGTRGGTGNFSYGVRQIGNSSLTAFLRPIPPTLSPQPLPTPRWSLTSVSQ